ncbi:MAG: winged helix-turn-helix transcriptional regulator [Bacteroidales bacterium]|nr:winged helix-turn-helix transcriptional regulator [Bacteroidales bacterium]
MKTIDQIKQNRKVSEELKEKVKEEGRIHREILKSLKEKSMTIPQIAQETGLAMKVVTYHLMTLMKYGKIVAGEMDDMDEFFNYKLKE